MIEEQMSLLSDSFDELPFLDLEGGREPEEQVGKPELLTIRLFAQAIRESEGNQSDALLGRFADCVLPNLLTQLAGATAKGGQFTEDRRAEGKNVTRSKEDQSFTAHLLNGLFPTYRILKILQTLDTNPVKRLCCDELEASIYIAAYMLHDSDKFPDYPGWLVANDTEGKFHQRDWRKETPHKSDAPNFGRGYVEHKMQSLGLDRLIGEQWRDYIDDIIWISHNAGEKWDADLGLKQRGLNQFQIDERTQGILIRLVRLSDLFASVIKRPGDIGSNNLSELLKDLSAGQLKFTYHALSDNRGVITNILNNALMDAHPPNAYTPLLYLPDGVVYLAQANAPNVKTEEIPTQVIAKIKSLCTDTLKERQTGFSRTGKGFKFAEYYWLYFDVTSLMEVAVDAACRIIHSAKASSGVKRSTKLTAFQVAGEIPADLDTAFGDDYRIDRLAEFGDLLCRKIWQEWVERFNKWQKKRPKRDRKTLPDLDLTQKLAEYLELTDEIPNLRAVQSIKNTGGLPLDWYYLAAKYQDKNPQLEDNQLREVMKRMVAYAASLIQPITEDFSLPDGWNDLRTYISRVVILPDGFVNAPEADPFLLELSRYKAAKILGRGRENVCAMSSSAYTVTEQMESATLFAPQVYSNRQILFNTQAAKRKICAIWSIEIMLRQILMNQTNATGGDFEGRKYRYLYLYPTYFFTPETNNFLKKAYSYIRRTRFDADIRKHLITDKQEAKFGMKDYQQVDSLLLQEESEKDQTFKLSYPSQQPLTFFSWQSHLVGMLLILSLG